MKARLDTEPPREGEYSPPTADHLDVMFCGHCPYAHVLLVDEEGNGIAQFTINLEQARQLVKDIEDHQ